MILRKFALLLSLTLLHGCAGSFANFTFTQSVVYQRTAKANFDKGMEELEDENYLEAAKYFTYVKNKYPFSAYATLAELRLADAYFADEKFTDAIDAYRQFHKFHPTHEQVKNGYVSYRICHAYVEQIPSDWFLIPPSHEKDQKATKEALRELTAFMKLYKNSPHLEEARKLKRQCVRRIADHELYVARFYLGRDKPKATIMRLEALLKRLPDAGVDPEVMLLLGQTYLKMKERNKARETFARLVENYPKDPYGEKAKLYIEHLGDRAEPEKADPKKADPKKADPKKANPVKADPEKADPEKADPEKADPEKADPEKADPEKADPKKAKSE